MVKHSKGDINRPPGRGITKTPPRTTAPPRWIVVVVLLLMTIWTGALYAPIVHFDFINVYDDWDYVKENIEVQKGLSPESIWWAFSKTRSANWHPVTWMSHMADVDLFGQWAGGHHLSSLLFHLINAALLMTALYLMTGALWRSAIVAAIFALHPINVESVAWVSERKNVLCTLFWMLSIITYWRYAVTRRRTMLLLVGVFMALGLMAKPMVVTLPFVLLLLDIWPLSRCRPHDIGNWRRMIAEKSFLFLMSAASAVITVIAQHGGGAVATLQHAPLLSRIANALCAYVRYIAALLWPVNLAIPYPYRADLPLWAVGGAAIVLMAVSFFAFRQLSRRPWWFVGWFWFLGTLVPVIGIVQVGEQSMADRYAYIPMIGFLMALAWSIPDKVGETVRSRRWSAAAGIMVVVALSWQTHRQLQYWENSLSLFAHSAAVTTHNPTALLNFGLALQEAGRMDDALAQYRRILSFDPSNAKANNNVGGVLLTRGEFDEALVYIRKAISLDPENPGAYNNLGSALGRKGDVDGAMAAYRTALDVKPDYGEALVNLASLLMDQGREDDAAKYLRRALIVKPEYPEAAALLGLSLIRRGQVDEGAAWLGSAEKSAPDDLQVLKAVGEADLRAGRLREAEQAYRRLLSRDPVDPDALMQLAGIYAHRQGSEKAAIDLLTQAAALAPERSVLDYNIACLYGRLGEAESAVAWLDKARTKGYARLENAASDPDLDPIRSSPAFQRWYGQYLP